MYFDLSGNTPVLRTSEGCSGGYHWTLKNRIKYAAKRWVERYNYVKGTYVKIMSAGGGISKEDVGLAFDLMTSYQIQNTNNIIAVDKAIHTKISGYYSSKQAFTGGKTVRSWLAGQSFEKQFEFGMQKLKDFGVIK